MAKLKILDVIVRQCVDPEYRGPIAVLDTFYRGINSIGNTPDKFPSDWKTTPPIPCLRGFAWFYDNVLAMELLQPCTNVSNGVNAALH